MSNLLQSFQRLTEIMVELREQCPWDRVQTKESLRHLTIEETFELADAVLQDDYDEIKVELGDLLLHIVFYARLAEEKKKFDMNDVILSLNEKLIRRHPHIYGDTVADSAEVVIENWEKIKSKENKDRSILAGVPVSMPALIQAYRMQEKASNVGFDWENEKDVWKKFQEETEEFKHAANHQERESEMGDILFSLVNYCRFTGINPDDALARTNHKFRKRFQYIEEKCKANGKEMQSLELDEMEEMWQEAKINLKI